MKKVWIAIGIVVLIGLLVGINIWKQQSKGNVAVETTGLIEETMSETVMTPGTLNLAKQKTIYFQADKGEVAEVFVKEGDTVEKGTELLRYENKQLLLEEKQNELQMRSSYLELNNIREQHKEIDKLIEEDKENEQLQEEHDQIKLQQQQANIEIEQAQLQKEDIEQQIAGLIVKSDISGTIVTINEQAASGSEQLQQEALIRIGSLDQLVVKGTISEYDTMKIEEGQSVVLKSDAVPDKSWKGQVDLVSYLPEEVDEMDMGGDSTGVQYPIEVTVEDEKINLKPGFEMLIEIEINKQKTNSLPLTAVKQDDESNYVYVVKNGKAEWREVEVGMVASEQIEINAGLTEKEEVIIDPSEDVKDGMEVTVK